MSAQAVRAIGGDTARAGGAGDEVALTLPQKAAVIISALPPEEAGSLLQKMGPSHIRAYVVATRQLRHVPVHLLERVVVEFLESLESNDITIGPDTAAEVLSRIMDANAVAEIIGEATGAPRPVWELVQDVPAEAIALYIEREHPRVASMVMSRLGAEKAAAVIDVLDVEAAEQVIGMLKTPAEVRPEMLRTVEESVRADLLVAASRKGDTPDVFVGAVFDNLTEQSRDPLMKSMTEKSPEFAHAVAKHMFLFDDVPARLAQKDVPSLTKVIDQAVLATGLCYAAARGSEAPEYILSYLPKRMAEQIREAMEEMETPDQKAGEEAEAGIIRSIRTLAASGEITLNAA